MITESELANLFEEALDFEADKQVEPDEARRRIAQKLANGVRQYVDQRTVTVIGVQTGSGTVTGTINTN